MSPHTFNGGLSSKRVGSDAKTAFADLIRKRTSDVGIRIRIERLSIRFEMMESRRSSELNSTMILVYTGNVSWKHGFRLVIKISFCFLKKNSLLYDRPGGFQTDNGQPEITFYQGRVSDLSWGESEVLVLWWVCMGFWGNPKFEMNCRLGFWKYLGVFCMFFEFGLRIVVWIWSWLLLFLGLQNYLIFSLRCGNEEEVTIFEWDWNSRTFRDSKNSLALLYPAHKNVL